MVTSGYAPANDGVSTFYEVHGEGRPLVLLHGGILTIDLSFGRLLPELAADRQVIAVELQGHGHTADADRPYTLAALAGDVAALLDHLGLARADVFGFSLGGLVATELALRHPARVDRLVLAASHFRPDGYHDDVRDPALFATSSRMPTEADFAEIRAAYERVAPDPKHFEEFLAKASGAVGTFAGWSPAELAGIAAPTLVVVGDNDFVKVSHADELRTLIPDARLAVLPGTTHMGLTGRTDLLVPMLREFLAG
jgi:pimeloyl-ACP methyl ester carboxylesterase